jgi:hypothetical protein
MRVSRTAALVLLLATSPTVPAAFAAPSRTTAHAVSERTAERAAFSNLRSWLVRLWSAEGCAIDPWGRCSQGSDTTTPRVLKASEGCAIDPLGRCSQGGSAAAPQALPVDEGCRMDPLGCRAAQR